MLILIVGVGVFFGLLVMMLLLLCVEYVLFGWVIDVCIVILVGVNVWSVWFVWKVMGCYVVWLCWFVVFVWFVVGLVVVDSVWWLMFWGF